MTTGKRLAVHGLVALAALGAAWAAWRHDQEAGDDETGEDRPSIVLAQLSREELKTLRFVSDERRVTIEPAPADGETSAITWVTVFTKRELSPRRDRHHRRDAGPAGGDAAPAGGDAAPAGADAGPAGADAGPAGGDAGPADGDAGPAGGDAAPTETSEPRWEERTVRFAGSDAVDELLSKVTPLRSYRNLGKLTAAQREEFELGDDAETLELATSNTTWRLRVGARTVGAGSRYYVLDERTGEGHLIDSKIIRDLELAGSRLMQRELHRFEPSKVAKAVVQAADRRRELEHRDREQPGKARWLIPDAPESVSKTATNWMRQLQLLRVLDYPAPDDDMSRTVRLFRVDLLDERGAPMGFVELAKMPPRPDYFGRSEATGTWVLLSRSLADQVATDVEELFSEE